MEVFYRQQVSFPGHHPFLFVDSPTFWAMPVAATVVRHSHLAATFTCLDMSSHIAGTAFLQSIKYPERMRRQFSSGIKHGQEVADHFGYPTIITLYHLLLDINYQGNQRCCLRSAVQYSGISWLRLIRHAPWLL